jgi:hypothetical protein
MASSLEIIDGQNWREFTGTGVVVLMLGKTNCEACARWTDELTTFLAGDQVAQGVRFGKMILDQKGLTDFKREHASWLKDVDVLPFNVILRDGQVVKSFAGSGIERLTNRLSGVLAG